MNITRLNDFVERSGLKKNHLAEKLGLSRQGLHLKLTGVNEFTVNEINILCDLLGIDSADDRNDVFFTN